MQGKMKGRVNVPGNKGGRVRALNPVQILLWARFRVSAVADSEVAISSSRN